MSAPYQPREGPTPEVLIHELMLARSALHEARARMAALRLAIEDLPARSHWGADAGGHVTRRYVALDDLRALIADDGLPSETRHGEGPAVFAADDPAGAFSPQPGDYGLEQTPGYYFQEPSDGDAPRSAAEAQKHQRGRSGGLR